MPYDDPEAMDPMMLYGVVVQVPDDSAFREMTACFVEEYCRSGFDENQILHLFKTKVYAGPFLAHQALGEDVIREIIDEQMALRRPRRSSEEAGPTGRTLIGLPVLGS